MSHAIRMQDRRQRIVVRLPLPPGTRILATKEPDNSWSLQVIGSTPPEECRYQKDSEDCFAIYRSMGSLYLRDTSCPNTAFLPTLVQENVLVVPAETEVKRNNIIKAAKLENNEWQTRETWPQECIFDETDAPYRVWRTADYALDSNDDGPDPEVDAAPAPAPPKKTEKTNPVQPKQPTLIPA